MSRRLNIDAMDTRHRALTPAQAAAWREAAAVSLSRHHDSPTDVTLADDGAHTSAALAWTAPDARTLDAWADPREAVQFGASACVIAAVEELRDLRAVRRAEIPNGADYYIGPPGSGVDDLEGCLRLEVSGVGDGDNRAVAKRLLEKKQQARDGKSSLPAIAGVMGFAARLLAVESVRESS